MPPGSWKYFAQPSCVRGFKICFFARLRRSRRSLKSVVERGVNVAPMRMWRLRDKVRIRCRSFMIAFVHVLIGKTVGTVSMKLTYPRRDSGVRDFSIGACGGQVRALSEGWGLR